MSIDGIKKWTELKASELEIVYDPLDDFLRMGHALRTAVEALEARTGMHGMDMVACAHGCEVALASIRKELGIGKEAPDA